MIKKMNIHEALATIKLYEKRIDKLIQNLEPICIVKSQKKINTGNKEINVWKKEQKADYQTIRDLMVNRDRIKVAVIMSNATTTVDIGGEKMTVAAAIEKKNSIKFDEDLLNNFAIVKNVYDEKLNDLNLMVDLDIKNMIEAYVGSDKSKDSNTLNLFVEEREKNDKYNLVNAFPVDVEQRKISEYVDRFKSNVDLALSTSNAVTFIEVDLH